MATKRRFFTLLEMLIVLLVLTSVVGVVAINIRNFVFQERFRSEVELVVDTLRIAQDLMLTLNTDVHVKFAKDKNQAIRMWIETESPLGGNWEREILRERRKLRAIHSVNFYDQLERPTEEGILDIRFLSGGSVMSRGTMYLASAEELNAKNALIRSVCLLGYPSPIKSFPLGTKCPEEDQEFAERLTFFTKADIQEPKEVLPDEEE